MMENSIYKYPPFEYGTKIGTCWKNKYQEHIVKITPYGNLRPSGYLVLYQRGVDINHWDQISKWEYLKYQYRNRLFKLKLFLLSFFKDNRDQRKRRRLYILWSRTRQEFKKSNWWKDGTCWTDGKLIIKLTPDGIFDLENKKYEPHNMLAKDAKEFWGSNSDYEPPKWKPYPKLLFALKQYWTNLKIINFGIK